jgi:hypothetical protein
MSLTTRAEFFVNILSISHGSDIYPISEVYIGSLPIYIPEEKDDNKYNAIDTMEPFTHILITGSFASLT